MTIIFSGGRSSGKTSRAIIESNKKNMYILVADKANAHAVAEQARRMSINIPYPITINELKNGIIAKSIRSKGIIIDEGQWLLQSLINIPIHMMTVTNIEEVDDE